MSNRKVVLYIGISLDGYIATKDDSLEWLLNTQGSQIIDLVRKKNLIDEYLLKEE